MKKYLKVLVALLCITACILSLAACSGLGGGKCAHTNIVAVGEEKLPIGIQAGMTAGQKCADCGKVIEKPYEFFRVTFVYSRKAEVTNANGKLERKNVETEVAHFDFPKAKNEGFTAELKAEAMATVYHGYSFIGWHTGWDSSTQTPSGSAYAFPNTKITANAKIYVERGDKVGENVSWALEDVDGGKELVISGTGAMFDLELCDGIDIPWYIERDKIVKVTVEDGVTTIGTNVFASLTKLTEVDLADSITSIGKNAFLGDGELKKVVLPAGTTVIKENAFKDCSNLRFVVLNDGLKTIEQLAFYGAKGIASIVVPASLETVANGAFHPGTNNTGKPESHSLSKVFYRGESEEAFRNIDISMDNKWFADFTTIYCYTDDEDKGVTGSYWYFDDNIPVQYTVAVSYKISTLLEPFAVDYVTVTPVRNEETDEIVVDNNGNVKEYAGVISEENVAFRNALTYNGYKFVYSDSTFVVGAVCKKDRTITCDRGNVLSDDGGIIWTLYDPDGEYGPRQKDTLKISVGNTEGSTEMWDFAAANDALVYSNGSLDGYKVINTLIIEPGVTYIGRNTFAGLINVTEVIIPDTVTEIHPEAFSGCTNLAAVYYEGSSLDACENITALETIPAMAFAKTEAPVAEAGSYWMTIGDKKIAWKLEDGTLTISGNSDMMDFASADAAPWYGAKDSITAVVIANNVINVGENIVNGYTGVTSLSFHNKVKDVPASAFAGTGIVNDTAGYTDGVLVVDGVLLKVDAESAANATFFKTVKGMVVVAGGAFDGCDNIKELYIVKGIIYMRADAFADLGLNVVYFETRAGMVNNTIFGEGIEKYFYCTDSEDPNAAEGFYYDDQGNIKLWKNG